MKPYFLNYSNHNYGNNETLNDILTSISGNIGNTYILHSIYSILFIKPPKEVYGISNLFNITEEISKEKINYINSNFTHILFNIQDQLRTNISYYSNTQLRFKLINTFLNQINIPIIIFGCGSNSFNYNNRYNIINELCEEQILFCKIISLKSKCIALRGEYTAKLFDDLDIKNYITCGCPSYYIDETNKRKIIKRNLSNIVITGSSIPSIVNINKYNISYFLQDISEINLIGTSPEYFFSIKLNELNNFFTDKDFVIGCRVHGSIIALNNGIPAICTSQDTRAHEMCKLFNIPHINNYTFSTIEELYEKVNFDIYNNNYSDLFNKFLDFLNKNDIDINNKLEYNEESLYIIPNKQFIYVYKGHWNILEGYIHAHTDTYIKTLPKHSSKLDNTEYMFIHQSSKIKYNKITNHVDNTHIIIEY